MVEQASLAKWVMELIDLNPQELDVSTFQPRSDLDKHALEQLMISMRETGGNLEPVLVRKSGKKLEVVAGHHRVEAAKRLGIQVLASVQEMDEKEAWQIALISNLVRKDMDPLDEARALQKLNEELGLSHDDIARRIGKNRSYVSRRIKLLSLPEEVLSLLNEPADTDRGVLLSVSHLVELLPDELTDSERKKLAIEASELRWPSKRLRNAVKSLILRKKAKEAKANAFLSLKTSVEQKREAKEQPDKPVITAKEALAIAEKELEKELAGAEIPEWEMKSAKEKIVQRLVDKGLVAEDPSLGFRKQASSSNNDEKRERERWKAIKIPDHLTWRIDSVKFFPNPRPHMVVYYSNHEGFDHIDNYGKKFSGHKQFSIAEASFLSEKQFFDRLFYEIIESLPTVSHFSTPLEYHRITFDFPDTEKERLRVLLATAVDKLWKYGQILSPVTLESEFEVWSVLRERQVYVFAHAKRWKTSDPVIRAKIQIGEKVDVQSVPSDLEMRGLIIHSVVFAPNASDDGPIQCDVTFSEGNRELMFFESVSDLRRWLYWDLGISTYPDDVFDMLESAEEEQERFVRRATENAKGDRDVSEI